MPADLKGMGVMRAIIIIFDALLALLIIGFSAAIMKTPFGAYSLAFGFAMLTITIVLRILQKW